MLQQACHHVAAHQCAYFLTPTPTGFYNLWTASALQANVTRAATELLAQHPGTTRLAVTGHSMGGALSALCALDLKFKLNFTDVRSWSFGSPRVGNLAWQELFNDHVVESWRFTHNRDVVPSLPPSLIGFHHLAREVRLLSSMCVVLQECRDMPCSDCMLDGAQGLLACSLHMACGVWQACMLGALCPASGLGLAHQHEWPDARCPLMAHGTCACVTWLRDLVGCGRQPYTCGGTALT